MMSIKNKEIISLGIVLFVITTVATLLLVTANIITKPKIDALASEMEDTARKSVLPEAINFDAVENFDTAANSVYKGYTDDGDVGYCINVTTKGFGGDLNTLVGIGINGDILGIKILQMSETPGLGSKANTDQFSDQYKGKSGRFEVITKPNPQGNQIVAISGATITSQAMTDAVNTAIEVFENLEEVNNVSQDTLDE